MKLSVIMPVYNERETIREILRQVMVAHGVPEEVQRAWLAHVDSLRSEVTSDPASECR